MSVEQTEPRKELRDVVKFGTGALGRPLYDVLGTHTVQHFNKYFYLIFTFDTISKEDRKNCQNFVA